ncbi:hypothetical protein yc1106_01139 [Curvularia clavata]|uniref:Uncharacterized protein n=1 Tax=Curvularia clavata TaxID=95742 RepID=A0A9Q8Z2A8_CURCL|nr:hypothetical protein yc1106_01139 [Curvularia clavata]
MSNKLSEKKVAEAEYSEASYYSIEPLSKLNLETTQPLQLRPFKPIYHMTMGMHLPPYLKNILQLLSLHTDYLALENTTLSDLIAMDNTYLPRLHIRRQLIQDHRREIIACKPEAMSAVLELYEWLIGTYLPCRFPTIYTLISDSNDEKAPATHLKNHATNSLLPLHVSSAELALEILGQNIDTEFLLLQTPPSPTPSPYHLTAFVNCFPSGFSTLSKLSLPLASIHAPVPHYAEKLQKSMDRYFASLPAGKIVKRVNWSISTNGDELFCLAGNHMSDEEHDAAAQKEEVIDMDKTVVRCERQTLHRLPRSGALVFAFKTYTYPIRQLRNEGSGPALADAIDGLALGSVPRITVYKRQVVWGEKVKAFLRGETEG